MVLGQTANFTISQASGCAPLSTNFTDISAGTEISRIWDLGNGVTSTAAVAGANYFIPAKYYISLTVHFSNGVISTKLDSIIVNPKPVAGFRSNDTLGCAPHSAGFTDLSVTPSGTITNWQWDFSAGSGSAQNPVFSFLNPGLYQVSLIVKNNWGCISDALTKPQYIKVFSLPQPGFTNSPVFSCKDTLTVHFSNTTANNSGFNKYEWDFGDGSLPDSSVNPIHFYNAPGLYWVTLKVKIGNNCSNSIQQTISVGTPVAQINSYPGTVCKNTPVLFAGSGTPAPVNLKWTFYDDNSIQLNSPVSHSFGTAGMQQFDLIASNTAGCSDTVLQSILVKELPVVDFSANKTTGNCIPFTVLFNNNSTGSGIRYTWNFGDGSPLQVTNTAITVSHSYTTYGSFIVSLTATDTTVVNGCSATKILNAITVQQPLVNFLYVPPVGCKPLPVLFTPQITNLTNSILNYSWNFGEGPLFNSISGTETHIYNNSGVYNAQLTISISGGCSFSSPIKPVVVNAICDDDGSGGIFGGGGFIVGKSCTNKYRVIFTDTVANTIVQSWDFGDGSPLLTSGVLNPVTHDFLPPQKIYLVTVTRLDTITHTTGTTQKRVIIIDEKANFAPDQLFVCRNQSGSVHTVGIDSSQIKNYFWNFGDGTPVQQINNNAYYQANGTWLNGNSNHLYTDSGNFYIQLIIEDKLGCRDTFQYPQPIVVKGPVANFGANPLQTCTNPFMVTFADSSLANGNNNITNWSWNFGDGSPVYNSPNNTGFTHTYNGSNYFNFYTVQLTIQDVLGCTASVTRNNYIKGYQPKAGFFSNDTLICGNQTVQLINNSNAFNASYTWNFGDGSTANTINGSHTYAADGFYTIKLVAVDENGCKDSLVKPAYIKRVKPTANFAIGDSLQCAPASFIFRDSSSYAVAYKWDFGDGSVGSTDPNPAPHIYGAPGFYTVKLKITGIGGCTDSITKQIRVRGPIGHLQSGITKGCKSLTVQMRVTGSFIQSYAWDFGDGTPILPSSSDSVVSHLYPAVGYYLPNVVLTSAEGCSYTLNADTVFVDSVKAQLTIFNNSICLVGSISTIQFNNNSQAPSFSGIAYSYCDFGDGYSDASNNAFFSHSYSNPGAFNILLAVQSTYGCKDTLWLPAGVVANAAPSVTITGPDSFCLKPATILHFNSTIYSIDSIIQYKWMIDTDSVGNGATLQINYRKPGVHALRFSVKTFRGCTAESLKMISIDSAIANFSLLPSQICGPGPVQFTNLSLMGVNYDSQLWTFGDGDSSITHNPVHVYNQTGVYTVKLTIESGLGCIDSLVKINAVHIDSIPKAAILGDSLKCKPGFYTYNSSITSSDPISSYEWKLNGNLVSNAINLGYNFLPGLYSISLKVRTIKGCEHTVFKNIVIDTVRAVFTVPDPKICGDTATVQFNNTSVSAFANAVYYWDFGDNQTGNLPNASHFYTQAGVYNVKLKLTTVNGCSDSLLIPQAVTIFKKPVLSTTVPARTCQIDTVLCTAVYSSNDSIISKSWLVNNVPVPATDSFYFHTNNPGSYTISYRLTTRYGCTITVSKILQVDPTPVPNAGPNTTICLGSPITLYANSGSSYLWTPQATLTNPNTANPVALPVADTRYHVVVTNSFGCVQTDSILIRTDKGVHLQVSGDAIICEGFSTQLQASGNTGRFEWFPATGLTNSQVPNPVANPVITMQYRVIGYSSTVCKNDTGFVTVTVKPNPVINAGSDKTVLAGVPTVLTTVSSPFVTRYFWTPSFGLTCTSCAAPVLLPNTSLEYVVTAFTDFGCKSSDSIRINVLCNKGAFYIPNAFTPNNDGVNDRFEIKGFGILKVNRLAVYDRYGHLIFERKDFKPGLNPNDGWDGTVNSVAVATATTFIYVAQITCLDGTAYNMKGTVVVVK
jgi:gliding motility-associated-like protein